MATINDGNELMSKDSTVEVELRPSAFTFVSIVESVSLMFVPYENMATTSERLLTELESTVLRFDVLPMERSIGSVTCVETSWALAPGSGVMTTTIGSWMSGSSSCLSEDHEKRPPSSRPSVISTVTLRFDIASCVSRITGCSLLLGGWRRRRWLVGGTRGDSGSRPAVGGVRFRRVWGAPH